MQCRMYVWRDDICVVKNVYGGGCENQIDEGHACRVEWVYAGHEAWGSVREWVCACSQ